MILYLQILFRLDKKIQRRRRVSQEVLVTRYIRAQEDPEGYEVKHINDYKGRGVFAKIPVNAGSFLFEYRGKRCVEDPGFNNYVFEFQHFGQTYWIDASSEDGSLGRLVNDSEKDFNAKIKKVIVDQEPYLVLIAVRDIAPGQEITFEYFRGKYSQFPWREQNLKNDNTMSTERREVAFQEARTDHETDSEEDDGITIDAIECLVKHEIGQATQELRSEIIALREEYDSLAFGQIKAGVASLEKNIASTNNEIKEKITRLNENSSKDKTMICVRIKQLEEKVSKTETLEEKMDKIEEEITAYDEAFEKIIPSLVQSVKQLKRDYREVADFKDGFEKAIETLDEKVTNFQKSVENFPNVVEGIIAAGELNFIAKSDTDCTENHSSSNDGQEESVFTASTPVEKNKGTQNSTSESTQQLGKMSPIKTACASKRPAQDSKATSKRLKQKWSWKKQNPGGLSFLEGKCQSPNFSRTSNFKDTVYSEGAEKGFWTKSTENYLKVCTKIDNLHKSMLRKA